MTFTAAGSVAFAYLLDAIISEPPEKIHPVRLLGRTVERLDRHWRHPLAAGVTIAIILPLTAGGAAFISVEVLRILSARVTVSAGVTPYITRKYAASGVSLVTAGSWLFVSTSRSMLLDVDRDVLESVSEDLETGRLSVSGLVGRDSSGLTPGQVRSCVVESTSENLADGAVAPLMAFAVGTTFSLSLGALAAVWVKAVNTLDSILGYRSKPHGKPSAFLDDAVIWIPARVSAVLLALSGLKPG